MCHTENKEHHGIVPECIVLTCSAKLSQWHSAQWLGCTVERIASVRAGCMQCTECKVGSVRRGCMKWRRVSAVTFTPDTAHLLTSPTSSHVNLG